MRVEVSVGEHLPMTGAKFGSSDKGAWALIKKEAERGYNRINIWIRNPDAVRNASEIEVVSVDKATVSDRKYTDKSGQERWTNDFSVDVTAKDASAQQKTVQTAAESFDSMMSGFMELPEDIDDDGMPFA
jgi:hypothetical protein